jgi:hypothetical protein|tara:strand:- start:216 stop:1007 length:792 start_codon:yes stop_codon:yes gene_type:complete
MRVFVFIQFCFILLGSLPVFADWQGRESASYPLGEDLSARDACRNAIQQTKLNALSQAGLETLSFQQFELCSETQREVECQLFQDTINKYDGGYISQYEIISQTVARDGIQGLSCQVSVKIEVKRYKDSHDPNFVFRASLEPGSILRNEEVIAIHGEVNQDAYIYLLNWYPDIDDEHYYLIWKSDEPMKRRQFVLDTLYGKALTAIFPLDQNLDETNEVIIVVATKTPFELLEKEPTTRFYQRLDEFGRQEWRLQYLAYRLLR